MERQLTQRLNQVADEMGRPLKPTAAHTAVGVLFDSEPGSRSYRAACNLHPQLVLDGLAALQRLCDASRVLCLLEKGRGQFLRRGSFSL